MPDCLAPWLCGKIARYRAIRAGEDTENNVLVFLGLFGFLAGLGSAAAAMVLGAKLWFAALVFLGVGMGVPLLFALVLAVFTSVEVIAPPADGGEPAADPDAAPHRPGPR